MTSMSRPWNSQEGLTGAAGEIHELIAHKDEAGDLVCGSFSNPIPILKKSHTLHKRLDRPRYGVCDCYGGQCELSVRCI